MAHVSLVTLGVDDLEDTTRFYEALGWVRSSASVDGTVAFLVGGAIVLGLYGRQALADEAGVEAATRGFGSIALAMNLASREEVDRVLATAERAGARITRPAVATDWGGYSGYVADPDGHVWEIAHNPGFPLGDDGALTLPV